MKALLFNLKLLGAAILSVMMMSSVIAGGNYDDDDDGGQCRPCEKQGKVVFVEAGAQNGNGSYDAPYGELSDVEGEHWDTLIVLPSSAELDGGIELKSGQTIIGKGEVKPIITNSSNLSNDGHGVVVKSGSVCIQNIHLKDTFAAGINYSHARNLRVNDVLITGHNQGEVAESMRQNIFGQSLYFIGGIEAKTSLSGHTTLCGVVVKDSLNGQGISEYIEGGAHRHFYAERCEVSGLSQTKLLGQVTSRMAGIKLHANDIGTKHDVKIVEANVHDFLVDTIARQSGFLARPFDGAKANYVVLNSRFENMNSSAPRGIAIYGETDPELSSEKSRYKLTVKDSYFNETALADSAAIQWSDRGTVSDVQIKGNTIIGFFDSIVSYMFSGAQNKASITGNQAEGLELFFGAAIDSNDYGELAGAQQRVKVKGNNYVGGGYLGAVGTANFGDNVVEHLEIDVKHNCFVGFDPFYVTGFAGLFSFGDTTNTIINAKHNNFTNWYFDIYNEGPTEMNAANNWWGQASGPVMIGNFGGGIVVVDPPLMQPIICSSNDNGGSYDDDD